jgi:hypothetical protein
MEWNDINYESRSEIQTAEMKKPWTFNVIWCLHEQAVGPNPTPIMKMTSVTAALKRRV